MKQAILIACLLLTPVVGSAQVAGDLNVNTPTTVAPTEMPKQTPKERVVFLLSAYHHFPTVEDLATAGDEATVSGILLDLAQDRDAVPTLRLRAVDAMAYYSDPLTDAYLVYSIETPTNSAPEKDRRTLKLIRHHAVVAYAKQHRDKALETLEPLLVGADLQLRLTAISAVGKQCGKAGVTRLQKLKTQDSNEAVQSEIRKFTQIR